MQKFPDNPGCYLFKDSTGRIIYIGKAKSLRNRISSYFTKEHEDEKTRHLVQSISVIDYIITDSEVEALVLENNLIKQHQPKYNINLKDAKRYAYIHQTDEKFPRLLIARKLGKGKFYGPFVSGSERDKVLKLTISLFKVRTCKKLPKKPCLRYHINLCTAPCAGHATEEQYLSQLERAVKVLSGNTAQLIIDLDSEMKNESSAHNFEKAMAIRDQLRALTYLSQSQKMERQKKFDEDVINFMTKDGMVYMMLFNTYKGTLLNKQEFVFDQTGDFFEEFLTQYYSDNDVPREIIVPIEPDDSVDGYLGKRRGGPVTITVPKIGEKKDLLDLVYKNIEIGFFGEIGKIVRLESALKLKQEPKVIECFDISHLSGTAMVGSMVQFRNGKPDKSNYRRFKIRTVEQIDDFAAIAEIVTRRYGRLNKEGAEIPDLVIIDGGKGQLNAAVDALDRLSVKLPVIALAKKFEEIYFPGSKFPLRLDRKDKTLLFLQEIRDEAHRFAIKYNRLLRKRKVRE